MDASMLVSPQDDERFASELMSPQRGELVNCGMVRN